MMNGREAGRVIEQTNKHVLLAGHAFEVSLAATSAHVCRSSAPGTETNDRERSIAIDNGDAMQLYNNKVRNHRKVSVEHQKWCCHSF